MMGSSSGRAPSREPSKDAASGTNDYSYTDRGILDSRPAESRDVKRGIKMINGKKINLVSPPEFS